MPPKAWDLLVNLLCSSSNKHFTVSLSSYPEGDSRSQGDVDFKITAKVQKLMFLGPWMHGQSSLSGDMRYETSLTWRLIIKCIHPPGMSSERELAHPICSNKIEHVRSADKAIYYYYLLSGISRNWNTYLVEHLSYTLRQISSLYLLFSWSFLDFINA